jgi:hypothetical protein
MKVQSIIKEAQGRRIWLAGVMLATLAVSMSSNASIVRFDNPAGPDHYAWGDEAEAPNWLLDITLSAADQGGLLAGPGVFFHTNTGPESAVGAGWSGDALQVGGEFGVFAVGTSLGSVIPGPYAWDGVGYVAVDGFGSAIAEGEQAYLGVRFNTGDGDHYGWIGIVRTGHDLDAFAWGYETEVGVPIAAGAEVPGPGSLWMVMMFAPSLLPGSSRRRR